MKPRLVGLLGDTHENAAWTMKAVRRLVNDGAEVIVQAGDCGYFPEMKTRYIWNLDDSVTTRHDIGRWGFGNAVSDLVTSLGVEFWFVDGNHENHDALATIAEDRDGTRLILPGVRHLPRGHRWTWGETTWMALGGAASIDRLSRTEGIDWWPQEVLSDVDVEHASAPGVDVIVSHDAPASSPTMMRTFSTPRGWDPKVYADCVAHRDRIETVLRRSGAHTLVHGHYHYPYTDVYDGLTIIGLDCDRKPFERSTMLMTPDGRQVGA